MSDVPSIIGAFFAGLLSFASPCVLPLVPSYLSIITGETVKDIKSRGVMQRKSFFYTLAFVLGFTLVFTLLGFFAYSALFATGFSIKSLSFYMGFLVIFLGLNLMFDFFKLLNIEKRFVLKTKSASLVQSFLLGLAFAFGWSPCIGPILGSILSFAALKENSFTAAILLISYSFGLGIPFFIMAFFFSSFNSIFDFLKRNANIVKIVSGLFLVIMGLLMVFKKFQTLSTIFIKGGFMLSQFTLTNPLSAKITAISIYAVFALLLIVIPILRKKKLLQPVRIVCIVILFALIVAENFGLISTLLAVSNWLLFQGI